LTLINQNTQTMLDHRLTDLWFMVWYGNGLCERLRINFFWLCSLGMGGWIVLAFSIFFF